MTTTMTEGRPGAVILSLAGVLAALTACGGGGDGATPDSRAPSGLTYDLNPAEYVRNLMITPNLLHQAGGDPATSFSVAPALPAGLALSPTTGAITGTPTATATQATYTVTASNAFGDGSVGLTLYVRAPTGRVISGTVNGVEPQLARLSVYRTSDDTLVGQAAPTSTSNGAWSLEVPASGTYRVEASLKAGWETEYKVYPSSRSVAVGSSDVVAPDFCMADAADQATICKVTLATYTPKIGGACVPFTADLVNWGSQKSSMGIATQLPGSLSSGASLSGCGGSGILAAGECTAASSSFCVPSGWSPGPQLLRVLLFEGNTQDSVLTVNIDLTE